MKIKPLHFKKNRGKNELQPPIFWNLFIQIFCITALFFIFEYVKELIAPDLTKWQSHLLSIIIAAVLGSIFLFKLFLMQKNQLKASLQLKDEIRVRKDTEKRLSMLSSAIEQCPTSVMITDTNGTIQYVNPKLTEITGYTFDEAIGKNIKHSNMGCHYFRQNLVW